MRTVRTIPISYLAVWIALLGLTLLSFVLSQAHLGSLDVVLALVIAFVKSTLVALFFMHLIEERFTIVIVPLVALFFFALLTGLVVADVATRHTSPPAPVPWTGDQAD